MALSNAEKQKRYRERLKLRTAGLLPGDDKPLVIPRSQSLSEYVQAGGEELIEAFDWLKEFGLPVEQFHTNKHKEQEIEWTHNLIRELDTALSTITHTLSDYWADQIDREIQRLKETELADPATKDDALAKIVRFTEMRKNLAKRYRLTLQNFEPEG